MISLSAPPIAQPRPLLLLLGLLTGLIGGVLSDGGVQGIMLAVARPVGALWLDALTMTVVPLVFGLLVTAVADASRNAAAGPVTLRTLIWFAAVLTTSCLLSAFLTEGLIDLWPVIPGVLGVNSASPMIPAAPTVQWYHGIIPANPIRAAGDTAMVPLVVFALILGFAAARLEVDLADGLLKPLRALVAAMLIIVGWVLVAGPIGVAALAFVAAASVGAGLLGALGQYVIFISSACLAAALLAYLWVVLMTRISPWAFARAVAPVQAVALGTQSSLATLPVMVEAARRLSVPDDTAGIVLPLAVSLFRASSAAANVAVAVYLAHMGGTPPHAGLLFLAALVAVPVSLGAVGLPAQVSFFATIAPVCLAMGAPISALPLLLAIEAVPDLFRTLGNVTNDVALACIVAVRRRLNDPT